MVAHPCPSDDRLLAFVEGLLDAAARTELEAHLAGCAECSAVVGATYRPAQPPLEVHVGRYAVLHEIGRGGMGRVLRARDPALDRDVAIKLILPSALSSQAKERFAREAETLGKLRHPNVLEVFDVGECDGEPYFVMEFVEGQSLEVWCRGRATREVLQCLRGAGRGLAAAHAAGVLHRDFKPSNVIVGPEHRPKVGDFGLAGVDVVQTAPLEGERTDSLTKTGAILGTLPYMAPELLEGGKASVASDQFAFCVTLHEALYGSRPFHGVDARELAVAIRRGEIPPAPAGVVVPGRARRALLRGLSPQPSGRFPSMRALLRELRPGRGRSTVGLVVGVSGLLAVSGAYGLLSTRPSACSVFKHALDGVYDSSIRRRIENGFSASTLPYAKASLRSTLEGLDAYAGQWVEGSSQTCRASERGVLPGDALDRRTRCFKHAAQGLDAMVQMLESADETHLESGGELLAALPNLHLCSDPDALARFGVLPANAAEVAQAATLEPIMSQADAKIVVDDFDGAWDLLQQHSAALQAASYPPLRVRALWLRARVLRARQDLEGARSAGLQAHELAVEHRLDADASRTAVVLGSIAARRGNSQEAERWFELALALAQGGGFKHLKAFTLATASRFYEERGQLDRAVEAAGEAVELIQDDPTYPPTSRAEVLLAYAERLFARGGGDDGLAEIQDAHRILLELHGDSHPAVGEVERALQIRASRRGDYEASYRHARESLRIATEVDGERSLQAIAGSVNLAIALRERGRPQDAARMLEHADALLDAWPAYGPSMRVPIMTNLGLVMLGLGRNDEARDSLSRAKAILETRTDQRERMVLVDGLLSHVELRDGNLAAARRLATGALETSIDIFGEDHFHTADVCTRLGHVELEAGNFALARDLFARALAVEETSEADRGEATFLLARATHEDPHATEADRVRGLELARDAKLALTSKPAYATLRAEVEAWLALRAVPK